MEDSVQAQFVVFIAVLTVFMGLGHVYVGSRLAAPLGSPWNGIVWAIVAANFVALPAITFFFRKNPEFTGIGVAGYVLMGIFSMILGGIVLVDLLRLGMAALDGAGRLAGQDVGFDPERRALFANVLQGSVVGLTAVGAALGYDRARQVSGVVRVDIPIAGLPPELDGFSIAQLTDIHVGMPLIRKDYVQAMVDRTNELGADLVAVTGDLVDGSVRSLREHTAPMASLRARHGVYYCTGNHEYYSGVHPWVDEVRRLGMDALINEHRVIEHAGHRLVIGGVTDITAERMVPEHRSDPHQAMSGAPTDAALRILLAHQPRSAYAAAKAGWDLQISGHTHGGQYFPGSVLIYLAQPFVKGLHLLEGMWIYVSTGTGYWGPPFRLGTKGEITLLRLVRRP